MSLRTIEARISARFPALHSWQKAFEQRTARDLVQRSPTVVLPSMRVQEAEQLCYELGIAHLVVVKNLRQPLGVLCLCDLWRMPAEALVSECMSSPPETVSSQTSIEALAEIVRVQHLGCLLVLEAGRVVGVVTRGDLRRAGILAPSDCLRCAACHTDHHVRQDPVTGAHLCVLCLDTWKPA